MKKSLLIIAVAGLAMASCKKDYKCTCTSTSGGVSASATTTIHETKKKATDACNAGSVTTAGGSVTCAIS